jgi:hypothetical protein
MGLHLSILVHHLELPNFGLWRSMYDTRTASLMMRSLARYHQATSYACPVPLSDDTVGLEMLCRHTVSVVRYGVHHR